MEASPKSISGDLRETAAKLAVQKSNRAVKEGPPPKTGFDLVALAREDSGCEHLQQRWSSRRSPGWLRSSRRPLGSPCGTIVTGLDPAASPAKRATTPS